MLLSPANSGPSWTTTGIIVFGVTLVVAVIIAVLIRNHRRSQASATTTTTTTQPATSTTAATSTTVTTTKSTEKKWGSGWSLWKTVKVTAAICVVVGVVLAYMPEIIRAWHATPQTSVVRADVRTQHHESVLLPSLADLAPQAPTNRGPQPLTVYRDHEVEIPKVSNPSKEWYLQTVNTTDLFLIRGEKKGVEVGVIRYKGIQDTNTPLPKDADTYYIRCINRDVTSVTWTEK